MNNITKPALSTAFAVALAALSFGAQASESFNAERGPEFVTSSVSVSRAEVIKQLDQARAAGLIVRGELYPQELSHSVDTKSFASVQRELSMSALMRAEAYRNGTNGYTRG